jgi:hypothetical protein
VFSFLPEARDALERMATFIREQSTGPNPVTFAGPQGGNSAATVAHETAAAQPTTP